MLSSSTTTWQTADVRIHPGGFRVVLAGAKVSRLLPFLQSRGFNAEAFAKGNEAMARLRAAPCHLLLFELECGDMMGIDLARGAKIEQLTGATLLVDDPLKSGMIIAALSRGIDSYVSLPPDETVFMDRIEGLLLQQWGLVVTQQQQGLVNELAEAQQKLAAIETSSAAVLAQQERSSSRQIKELETRLQRAASSVDTALKDMTERHLLANRRVGELTKELGMLRDQLATMHMVAGSKAGTSDEGAAANRFGTFDDDLDDVSHTLLDARSSAKGPTTATKKTPSSPAMKAATATSAMPFAAPKQTTRPGPVSGVGASIAGDVTDDFQLADLPAMSPRNAREFCGTEEPTQAIPAALARSLLDDEAHFAPTLQRGPASAKQSIAPPGSINALSDFLPPTGSFELQDDARTQTVSSPLGLELEDLQALATSANSFGNDDDFNARTMAVPAAVTRAMIAAKKPPPGSFFFDDAPADGDDRAPPVPGAVSFNGNDDRTAPRGIEATAMGRSAARRPTLTGIDAGMLSDASRIPLIDDEEVMFLDDD